MKNPQLPDLISGGSRIPACQIYNNCYWNVILLAARKITQFNFTLRLTFFWCERERAICVQRYGEGRLLCFYWHQNFLRLSSYKNVLLENFDFEKILLELGTTTKSSQMQLFLPVSTILLYIDVSITGTRTFLQAPLFCFHFKLPHNKLPPTAATLFHTHTHIWQNPQWRCSSSAVTISTSKNEHKASRSPCFVNVGRTNFHGTRQTKK